MHTIAHSHTSTLTILQLTLCARSSTASRSCLLEHAIPRTCGQTFSRAAASPHFSLAVPRSALRRVQVRTANGEARRQLFLLERGVCQLCKLDAFALFKEVRECSAACGGQRGGGRGALGRG